MILLEKEVFVSDKWCFMSHLLDNLPEEVSYIREYAMKYGRDTEQETFDLIHKVASLEGV